MERLSGLKGRTSAILVVAGSVLVLVLVLALLFSTRGDETGAGSHERPLPEATAPAVTEDPIAVAPAERVLVESADGRADPASTDPVATVEAGAVGGVVRDAATGEPVREFEVRVLPPRADSMHPFATEDGRFEVVDLEPGSYWLTFMAEGYLWENKMDVAVEAGVVRRDLDVWLRRGAAVRGTVVERGSGRPIAGALFEVAPVDGWSREVNVLGPEAPRTGEDGRFEMAPIVSGVLRVRARHDRYVEGVSDPVEVGEGETVDGVVVALARGGGIEGVLVDEAGSPIAGAEVFVCPVGRSGWRHPCPTDEEGRFEKLGLDPGRWRVEHSPARLPDESFASWESRNWLSEIVEVPDGTVVFVTLGPPKPTGASVRGRVLRGNEGVPEAFVRLEPTAARDNPEIAEAIGNRLQTTTASDGTFGIEGAPPGPATLEARGGPNGYPRRVEVEVPVAGEAFLEVRLPGGAIEGRVAQAADGAPVPEALVTVLPANRTFGPGEIWRVSARTRVAPTGRYQIRDLADGSYRVVATRGSYRGGNRPVDGLMAEGRIVEVEEGASIRVDFDLVVGGEALVVVRDASGRPASSVSVRLSRVRPGEREELPEISYTDETGTARVKGMSEGMYFASLLDPGKAGAFSEVLPVRPGEAARFDVQVSEGTRIRIRIHGADGRPISRPFATLVDERGRWMEASRVDPGSDDERDGWQLRANVPPGAYTVEFGSYGRFEEMTSIVVGRDSRQSIELGVVGDAESPK